jgi:hypothetical protein
MSTMTMSASGDKADIPDPLSNVCKWPKADIAQHLSGCSEPLAAGPLLRQGAPLDVFRVPSLDLQGGKVAVASS